jgi:hypothetical protein
MNKTDKSIWDKLKREDCIPFLDEYYKNIGRTNPPDYNSYSLQELKKCLVLFNIHLVREKHLEEIQTEKK